MVCFSPSSVQSAILLYYWVLFDSSGVIVLDYCIRCYLIAQVSLYWIIVLLGVI